MNLEKVSKDCLKSSVSLPIQSLSTVLKPKQVYCKNAGLQKEGVARRSSRIVVDGVGNGR